MADFYCSVNPGTGAHGMSDLTNGTSTTAADKIELRMDQTAVTRLDVIRALEQFKRWIIQGGLKGAGANLPLR
jgi:hypothetical protein